MEKRSFASDNNAGVHPEILKKLSEINQGHCLAYGDDQYTKRAVAKFKEHFGENIEVFFVFNGTSANVLSLKAMTESFNSIICSEYSHIQVDECGAPEKFTGCKLIPVANDNGKLTVEQINKYLHGIGDQHHTQPKVISITQVTEVGTVYTQAEIRKIADFAHTNNMLLHMDGARIANAAASLKVSLKEITADAGVDVLSFGGTKNGLMFGEAVIFFNQDLARNFLYIRKQGMQLASKMRFIAVQLETILTNDLWLKNASHANQMANLLANQIRDLPGVEITQEVQANGIFVKIPKESIKLLQDKSFFYVWNPERSEVRWMCSFDTTEEDIYDFVKNIKEIIK